MDEDGHDSFVSGAHVIQQRPPMNCLAARGEHLHNETREHGLGAALTPLRDAHIARRRALVGVVRSDAHVVAHIAPVEVPHAHIEPLDAADLALEVLDGRQFWPLPFPAVRLSTIGGLSRGTHANAPGRAAEWTRGPGGRSGRTQVVSKYSPLRDALHGGGTTVTLTLEEIADLVGGLPPSAYSYTAWWSNEDLSHVQSQAWESAGYRAEPDLRGRQVRFTRH